MDSMMTLLMPFLSVFSVFRDRDPGLNFRALGKQDDGKSGCSLSMQASPGVWHLRFLFYVLLVSVERAAWFADVWQAWSRQLRSFSSCFFLSIYLFPSFLL
jgi:hypothetical protein